MESKTVYFENTGSENTEAVLRIAGERARQLGIKNILVPSTRGGTAVKAVDALQGLRVIVVTHVAGFKEPNSQELTAENKQKVESEGGTVLTTTHAFGGLSKAIRNKYKMHAIGDFIADTLRIFGHGVKVACEITLMAADSGLINTGEDVISIGGTDGGADTAVVLTPANTHNFFDLKVKEILCKPRL